MAELEALSGRPFTLAGFDWDSEAMVHDWGGGRLERLDQPERRLILRLRPESGAQARDPVTYEQVLGDRRLSSTHPVMGLLNPRVYEIMIQLGRRQGLSNTALHQTAGDLTPSGLRPPPAGWILMPSRDRRAVT